MTVIPKSSTSGISENEVLLQLLVDTKDYAIVMLDPAGKIMSWNLGAEDMFGYASTELIGKHMSLCYSDGDKTNQLIRHLANAIEQGRVETETQLMKKDGSHFFANIICTPLRKIDGDLRGFACTLRDITTEKQLAEENRILRSKLEERVRQRTKELENVNKELNAFSYSVSHDLRTPLRAISGFSKMLLEDYQGKLDSEADRILNIIVENAEMMGRLIDDLLAFSRLSRMEVLDKKVNMKSIVDRCINDLLQVWTERRYSISVSALPPCNADPNMMKQVWMNLIENSLKYSSKRDHPELVIGYKKQKNLITYFIRDNGAGFDMQYASKLFGVFQRLHLNEEFPGTGLGLALVNRIVTKHGGRVWGESEVDKGATFYFSMPINY